MTMCIYFLIIVYITVLFSCVPRQCWISRYKSAKRVPVKRSIIKLFWDRFQIFPLQHLPILQSSKALVQLKTHVSWAWEIPDTQKVRWYPENSFIKMISHNITFFFFQSFPNSSYTPITLETLIIKDKGSFGMYPTLELLCSLIHYNYIPVK